MSRLHRRSLLATSLATLALPGAGRAQSAQFPAPGGGDGLSALLAASGAPALAGIVLTPAGVQLQVAEGVRRIGGADPVTQGDLWHIGSNTKAMTAALYGRYVEAGRAAWGAKLPALFADLTLDAAWNNVTIEDLLSHRSGISDAPVMEDGWLGMAHADRRPLADQRTELATQVLAKPPTGATGRFEYSNVGYILAGAAIERITGQGWEVSMAADLFNPLEMASAGFGAPQGANPWGHAIRAGALRAIDPTGLADNPPALGPAGTVRLSMADYARFARIYLTDGGGYLSAETIARLSTAQPGDGPAYGLGWGVSLLDWGQGAVLSHEGSNTLWHAVALVAPKRGLAILTACNCGPDASKRAALALAQRLKDAYAPG